MKKLKVTITIAKNGAEGYICSCDYRFKHFDLGGSGATVEEAKEDCFLFYDEMKREYPEENFPELEVSWVYDFPSFFNHFDFLNVTGVAKYAAMSPSNFRHYVAGSKNMSQKQFSKVKQAFDRMADELKACTFTMQTGKPAVFLIDTPAARSPKKSGLFLCRFPNLITPPKFGQLITSLSGRRNFVPPLNETREPD